MASPPPPPELAGAAELIAAYQRRLFLYIAAMLPRATDADEVLQETNIVIWKKLDEFAPGTDFLAWAFRIAYFQVLYYRRRKATERVTFASDVLEELSAVAIDEPAGQAEEDERGAALVGCTKKLPDADRELLERCYAPKAQIPEVAATLRRTPTSVYRSLRRIRQLLADCVQKTLTEEG